MPQAILDISGVDEELLAANGQGPLSAQSLRAVLGEVASGCRALVREPRIAVLGPLYSLSHLAAIRHFGQSVEFVPVGSVAAVFEEVCRKQSDLGLAPLENSTDGRVADTLAMLAQTGMRICGEVELKIHHALLAKCPRTEVREVYSRPEALAVPRLAGEALALGPDDRGHQYIDRGAVGVREAGRGGHCQPGGGPPLPPGDAGGEH